MTFGRLDRTDASLAQLVEYALGKHMDVGLNPYGGLRYQISSDRMRNSPDTRLICADGVGL